ncbi:hypothetical protein ACFW2D_38770 [Streptomyces sp. NPDC058914]
MLDGVRAERNSAVGDDLNSPRAHAPNSLVAGGARWVNVYRFSSSGDHE